MVKVTPHSYVLRSSPSVYPGMGYGKVLDLYSVGDVGSGYRAFTDSWILDDRREFDGTEVRGDPDEVARWTEAQRAAEAALRDAEAQLLCDHGEMEVRHDAGARSLRAAPGWGAFARRWRPRGSQRAVAQYWERVRRIEEAYRSVRDEIGARVREAKQQVRERSERMQAVAARSWWSYRVDRAGGTVHISHEDGATLDTRALAEKLLEVRRHSGVAELRWDHDARAEVARSSGVDFETWWRAVAPPPWTDSRTIPQTRIDRSGRAVHVSAHTSFGTDFGGSGDSGGGGF